MAKHAKLPKPSAATPVNDVEAVNEPRLFTIEEILQELNKLVDPKLQIITTALDLAAKDAGSTGMAYILKVLNFEEVLQEDETVKYKQVLPAAPQQ